MSPRESSDAPDASQRVAVCPRQPLSRTFACRLVVLQDGRQILEWILAAKLSCVDERHEHVADLGAALTAVEERVSPVPNGHLQGALANVVVDGHAWFAQKQG